MAFGHQLDSWGNFIKYSLFIVNLLIFFGGLIVTALSLWTVIDKTFPNELLGTNLYSGAAWVILITSLLVTLLSCFGCFGSVKEIRCMLLTYFVSLFLIFVTMFVGGLLGFVFREKVDITLKNGMIGSIRFYGNYKPVTHAWDETQSRLYCCGVYNYHDWKDHIPDSCCKPISGRIQHCQLQFESQNSFTIYQKGCYNVTKDYLKDHAAVFATPAIILALLLLLGIIFSIILFRKLK